MSKTPLPRGVEALKIRVEKCSFMEAAESVRRHGLSETKFRVMLKKLGVNVLPDTYPDLFYVLTDVQLAELQEIRPDPSLEVRLGTSEGVGLTEEEAFAAFKRATGASTMILS